MKFSTNESSLTQSTADCICLPVFKDGVLGETTNTINQVSGNAIQALIDSKDVTGKAGETQMLFGLSGVASKRILLVGMGDSACRKDFNKAQTALFNALKAGEIKTVLNATVASGNPDCLRASAQLAVNAHYNYTHTKANENTPLAIEEIDFFLNSDCDESEAQKAISMGQAIANGMALTRDLGNLPGNICTPTYIAEAAQSIAAEFGMKATVLDMDDCEKIGMGSFLSVARGSHEAPKFITLEYNGGGDEAPICLVGKGVTFDTGGISLKPGLGMDEMKFDMLGAGSVLGAMRALGEMQLPMNVVAVIPSTENMPNGNATKPGDVITSLSGQTIEVLNTDAEGRLILCDALTYAQNTFKPSKIVDVATLTGACIVALGHHVSGMASNDDELANELLQSGETVHDRCWRLPLYQEYDDQLDSNFADMGNIGGAGAGTITAACFLQRFIDEGQAWAHLDIAGTAWLKGKDKGASGRPVPLLTEFLIQNAG